MGRSLKIDFDLYTEGDQEHRKELASLLVSNLKELQSSVSDAVCTSDSHLFKSALHKAKVSLSMLEDAELMSTTEVIGRALEYRIGHESLQVSTMQFNSLCKAIIEALECDIEHTPQKDHTPHPKS